LITLKYKVKSHTAIGADVCHRAAFTQLQK